MLQNMSARRAKLSERSAHQPAPRRNMDRLDDEAR
jgi:hypothetical protein